MKAYRRAYLAEMHAKAMYLTSGLEIWFWQWVDMGLLRKSLHRANTAHFEASFDTERGDIMQVMVKKLIQGKWKESMEDIATLDQYKGTDTVALLADGYVWVGNDRWYEVYADKNYMVTNSTEMMPIMELAQTIFRDNKEERQAIMEVEGVPQQQIIDFMATRPDLYPQEEWPDDF